MEVFLLKHINAPDESILPVNNSIAGNVPVRTTFHGGAEIPFGQHNKYESLPFISPNMMFVKQGGFHQLNLGAYVSWRMLYGGTWYRHTFTNSDAVIMLAGFQKGIFKIGYSYDITVSGLSGRTGGAHEISLMMNFDNTDQARRNRAAKRYINCLKMFR